MYLDRKHIIILIVLILFTHSKCAKKAFPDNAFKFHPEFRSLFNSITAIDTMTFVNAEGKKRQIIKTAIDSMISNYKGGINTPRPHKTVSGYFIEKYLDKTYKYETYIHIYPDSGENTISIQFGSIRQRYTDILPNLITDTIGFEDYYISNYYLCDATKLGFNDLKNIGVLYFDSKRGVLGFKSLDGEIWVRDFT